MISSSHLCLLSDFDGTLVPFDEDPNAPQLPAATRRALEGLAGRARNTIGIVSGRALSDLEPRIGIPKIWYVGNHGYEVRRPSGEEQRFYEASDVEYMAGIRLELDRAWSGIPGIIIEHKGPILAVHYRTVGSDRLTEVQSTFLRIIEPHHHRVMIAHGKWVLEARTRGAMNKARAVSLIQRELPPGSLILYLGDDLTDRDVFRELKGSGLSVEVGGSDSGLADFTLPSPEMVTEVLCRLLDEVDSAVTLPQPARKNRKR
jgi:trehalose-phosphatase